MKLIFLDIDGVLNGHDFDAAAQSCRMRRECVERFNRLLAATGAKVVLSSAWRYLVTGGAMTLKGFGYMLRTHGVVGCDLIGHTCTDEDCAGRGKQIAKWLSESPLNFDSYVVLDDDTYDILDAGHSLVCTDGALGLTDANVDAAIRLLAAKGEK